MPLRATSPTHPPCGP
jgi:hypothetical protein